MVKNNYKIYDCPVEDTLQIIGNKWTVLIIRDLLLGVKRFGELLHSLDGVSPRTLSSRLKQLEQDNIIRKKIYPVVPLHTEYSLTMQGKKLSLVLDQMIAWNNQYRKK